MTWFSTWPENGKPKHEPHDTEAAAEAHAAEVMNSKRALVATIYEAHPRTLRAATRGANEMNPEKTAEERFAAFFVKTPGGCWYWWGRTDRDNYGRFDYEGQDRPAPRVMMMMRGHDVAGLDIDHLCRRRRCVNPLHLDVVTRAENNRRKLLAHGSVPWKGKALKTRCINGHEFTPENTYAWAGGRNCRACNRETQRRRRNVA